MGTMTPHKTPKMKIYTKDEIRAMRVCLRENRYQFSKRFYLTSEAVKGWELGRRKVSGPALVILQQIEGEVNIKKEESRKILEEYRRGCVIKQKSERP